MSADDDESNRGTGLVRDRDPERGRALARLRRTAKVSAGAVIGGAGGFAISSLVPTGIVGVVGSIALGLHYARSRVLANELHRGDFARYEQSVNKKARGRGFLANLARMSVPYCALRQNRVPEALETFQSLAAQVSNPVIQNYASAGTEACRVLAGEEPATDPPESSSSGTELYQCIIHGKRGNLDAVRALRTPRYWIPGLLFGRKRVAHERRTIELIKATLLPTSESQTSLQRRLMAAYPGEYDYIADRWPEVAARVAELDLYPARPPRAIARR